MQTVYPLPGGAALLLTTDKYYTPNDVDINEVGIIPDYVVKNPDDSSSDAQMKKSPPGFEGEASRIARLTFQSLTAGEELERYRGIKV